MSAAVDTLLELREATLPSVREGEAEWISSLRDRALAAFREQGIPTRSLEDWKGTSLAALEKIEFARVGAVEPGPVVMAGGGAPLLRFLDGRLVNANAEASRLPSGARWLSLAEARRQAPELLEGRLGGLADPKRHALVALQTACLDDGAVLAIEPGVRLETPIHLRFETSADGTAAACFPRLLLQAGEGSQALIFVEHVSVPAGAGSGDGSGSAARGLTAFVAELALGRGSRIEAVQLQDEEPSRIHFTSTHARLERDACLESRVFTTSTGLVRSELEVVLAEPGSESRMRGFYLGRDRAHVDHFTTVDHAVERCTSDEEYRGVLGDHSEGVFRGRVIVRPDAQKTDARQSNPNLLVSDRAKADSKPQLEIYADDVRASHGSTIGQLDPEALFFLRARGIGAAEARLLLTRAFAHAIVDGIESEAIRAHVAERVDGALAELEGIAPAESNGDPA